MEKVFAVETQTSPSELFAIVSDLSTFPCWIDLVLKVDPAPPGQQHVLGEGAIEAGTDGSSAPKDRALGEGAIEAIADGSSTLGTGAGGQPGVGSDAGEPTWWVTLRAQLGPLARSKRLRMRRTVNRPPSGTEAGLVRFERAETDGRDHAEWTMEVAVGAPDDSSGRAMFESWARCRLYYGGAMWTSLLEGQLDAVADRATERLRHLAEVS
ncbi:MAG: hypothetical protein OER95_14760 [Acidimicrobiia bacterium]|nr:hypothetical protein [Acidimicrobiia bacterium]